MVCINDIFKNEALAYLLKYDTIMGTLKQDVTHDDHALYVGGKKILDDQRQKSGRGQMERAGH